MTVDDFLEATLDVWELAPESARRVDHPAPFPVELPQRLIELYTYAGDLVLDPFMGVGSTAVAAVRTGRRFVGFDTDAAYIERARRRIAAEREEGSRGRPVTVPPATRSRAATEPVEELLASGAKASTVAKRLLQLAGFTDVDDKATAVRERGVQFDLVCRGADGRRWLVLVAGGFTPQPTGLRRSDVLWRTIAHAAVVSGTGAGVLVLTTDVPTRGSAPGRALATVVGTSIDAVVELTDPAAVDTLQRLHRPR